MLIYGFNNLSFINITKKDRSTFFIIINFLKNFKFIERKLNYNYNNKIKISIKYIHHLIFFFVSKI